jgi:hypothetical protein
LLQEHLHLEELLPKVRHPGVHLEEWLLELRRLEGLLQQELRRLGDQLLELHRLEDQLLELLHLEGRLMEGHHLEVHLPEDRLKVDHRLEGRMEDLKVDQHLEVLLWLGLEQEVLQKVL